MKILLQDESPKEQVEILKKFLAELPNSNWFKRNPFVNDHLMGEDAALFDLLLHPRDRSYLVSEIEDFLASSDLVAVGFIPPAVYDPATYLADKILKSRIAKLPLMQKMALGERIAGNIKTHVFYAVPEKQMDSSVAKIAPDMIPVFLGPLNEQGLSVLKNSRNLKIDLGGGKLAFPMPENCANIIDLIDGKNSLRDIQAALSLDWNSFRSRFAPLYKILNGINIILLRAG